MRPRFPRHSALIRRLLAVWFMAAVMTGLGGCNSSSSSTNETSSEPTNFVIIFADDVGYSDISAFGSEIKTPHIDALAHQGIKLTNFHSTPLCATSRAALLTGADQHLVGVGALHESSILYPADARNYKGSLDSRAVTIAELLQKKGYHTYMAGKWHLGGGGPSNQGFEKSFSLQYEAAFASNFSNAAPGPNPSHQPYFENGKKVTDLPADFFSSNYFTSRLIKDISRDHGDGKPFFAYLSFQAAHFPLQAPDQYLDQYKGVYNKGYAYIRKQRIQRMKQLGIIPESFQAHTPGQHLMYRFGQPAPFVNKPWDELTPTQQKREARTMEVYAAMVDNMDDNIGRLMDYLKEIGEYDNTIVIFLSDNGPDGMGYGFVPYTTPGAEINNSLANYGKPGSFLFRSTRWAAAGAAPFRLFKGFTAEGGISVPAIVKMPQGAQYAGRRPSDAFVTLKDIAPTVLELAGFYNDHPVAQMTGNSLMPVLTGQRSRAHGPNEVFAGEVNNVRYVRKGKWKLTRIGGYLLPLPALFQPHQWQLYNMKTDRGETNDLAGKYPGKVQALTAQWQQYKARVNFSVPVQLAPNPNATIKWQPIMDFINNKRLAPPLELDCQLVTQCQPPRESW